MKVLLLAALAVLLEAVRLTWLSRLALAPDPLLGMLVLLALARRPAGGAGVGLLLGGFRDLVQGGALGPETAVFTLAGWSVSSLGRSIYREAALTQALMMFLCGIGRGIILYVVLVGESAGGLVGYLIRTALPGAAATAVCVPLVVHLARRVRRFRFRRKRKVHDAPVPVER